MEFLTIYITGANGFIGQELIKFFYNKFADKNIIGISYSDKNYIEGDKIYSDYKNTAWLKDNIEIENSIVIHTAAYIPSEREKFKEIETLEVNEKINSFVYECFKDSRKIVYFSSVAVYGYGYKELKNIDESSEIVLEDYYAKAKYNGEKLFSELSKSCILRLTSPYGKNKKNKNILEKTVENIAESKPVTIYGKGERTQDFIYVKDICEIIYLTILNDISGTFNFGNGNSVKMTEIIKTAEKVMKKEAEIVRINIKEENFTSVNTTKLREKTGYNCRNIEEGIIDMYFGG
jgi:UDP-glucose 4-epimerase